jgi:sigma54-dependent transcription regulator
MENELVFIYATGGDTLLRKVCWDLLEQRRAIDADLIGQSPAFINDRGKRKIGLVGRAVVIVALRAELAAVTARLEQAKQEDSRLRAYVMPVLGSVV